MKKGTIIILAIVLLLCGLAAFLVFTDIDEVKVTGNAWYTADEVEELIFPDKLSKNSAYAWINELLGKKREIPFIEDYKIIFESTNSVEVIVYEKSIVGYVNYMDNCMYFDKDGIIVDSSTEKLSGIPEITGLEFGTIILYRKLPVADEKVFDDILNLTQFLTTYDIHAQRINYSGVREATLYIGDIIVELGTSSEMNEKIAELHDMLPYLAGMKGTLYLDSYESKSSNPAYTFRPE